MKIFKILLINLINDVCEPLYDYNQYLLKRFFEYALTDKEYIKKLKSGLTGLNKIGYCPKHEKVVMTACIQSLSFNNDSTNYKLYYSDYLKFKTTFMGWRGRSEWFDFHRTVLSHFIWNENLETFMWTWTEMNKYLKNFKNRYPKISDWRRRWYIQEVGKIKIYLAQVCAASEKINILEYLINQNVIHNNSQLYKVLIKLGLVTKKNKICQAEFVKTPEWEWLRCDLPGMSHKLNTYKCLDICIATDSFKSRLIDIFKYQDSIFFWKFFLYLNEDQFLFINNRNFVQIINNLIEPEIPESIKQNVVQRVFEFNAIIKFNLIKKIKFCLKDFKIDICKAINIVTNIIKHDENADLTKFEDFCQCTCMQPGSPAGLDSQQTYWLYKLFKDGAMSTINQSLKSKQIARIRAGIKDECPICYNTINRKSLCILPCGHAFHKNCIITDIHSRTNDTDSYNCPICRSKIIPESIHDSLI